MKSSLDHENFQSKMNNHDEQSWLLPDRTEGQNKRSLSEMSLDSSFFETKKLCTKTRIENANISHGSLRQTIPFKKADWWTSCHLRTRMACNRAGDGGAAIRNGTTASIISAGPTPTFISTDSLNRYVSLEDLDIVKAFRQEILANARYRSTGVGQEVSSPRRSESSLYFSRPETTARHVSGGSSAVMQNIAMTQRLFSHCTVGGPSIFRSVKATITTASPRRPFPPVHSREPFATVETSSSTTHEKSQADGDTANLSFRAFQAESWTEKFRELVDFRREYGHCLVPNSFPVNQALAAWVKRQRYQYKLKLDNRRSTLSDQRIRALNGIGFVWYSHVAAWDERLNELVRYKYRNGDCNVPSRYADNRQLALWVKRQRRQYKLYKEGQLSSMTRDRIARLEAIDFVWDLAAR